MWSHLSRNMQTTLSIDQENEYKPLSDEQDYFDTEKQSSPSPSPSLTVQRWKWAALSLAVLSVLQFLLLVWPKHLSTPGNTYEAGFSTDFDDAKPHIRLEERRFGSPIRATENGTLYRVHNPDKQPFTGNYTPEELNASWEQLIGERYFRFEELEVQKMNEDTFQPDIMPLGKLDLNLVVPETGAYGSVDMLHSLHCLDALRRHLRSDGHMEHHPFQADWQEMHIDHCIDQLRQTIMCSGDLTPVTLKPVIQTRDGKSVIIYLGETERKHTCRNFESIKEWVRSRGEKGAIHGM